MANNKISETRKYTLSELVALADIPANKQREFYHALWLTGKRHLSADECAQLWEHMKPAVSGVKAFAGKGWRKDHPDDANPLPGYVTEAQEKRKAEKAAAPKADKPAAPKADKPAKASKPAAPKAPAKPKADKPAAEKAPTYTETLGQVVDCMTRMTACLTSIDKRLSALEKKLAK